MIAIYIVTKNMTIEQHTKGRARLQEAGAPEGAMKLHSCFGEDGQLQVFDIWESQEAFDEFLKYLGPVMEELGIELAHPPTIMPIVAQYSAKLSTTRLPPGTVRKYHRRRHLTE